MIVYTNGCSHTAGGCFKQVYSWPNLLMKSILGKEAYSTNPPTINFNSDSNVLYNQAKHGAGNDYIFHKSLETISSLIQNDCKPDYVIIQWSGANRRLHCYPDGNTVFVNLFDNTGLGVKFEPMGSEHTIHYMFALQEFLKKNNIDYLFFNYMAIDESIVDTSIFKELDLSKFVEFGMGDDIIFNGLIDFLKSKNMCCDKPGHPNHEGSHLIATEIGKRLNVDVLDIKTFHQSIFI